jgi:kynurenine formamidase
MGTIDLSHTISPGMPVYPGTEPPIITSPCTLEKHGFIEKKLVFYSHTGTHIDAPAHIFPHAPTLDQMPADSFIGRGSVIDLTGVEEHKINISHLGPYENLFKRSDFILLHTGWDRFWGREKYFRAYPVLTGDAAVWIRGFGLKGIGVDMISVDETDTTTFPVHKILLEGSVLIENLTNLEKLPETGFTFSLPVLLSE